MFAAPFDQHPAPNAGGEIEEAKKSDVPSTNFFRETSGKVLTEKNADVSLETFPLVGSGSLKFTLCD
jgi:hypothetical protein